MNELAPYNRLYVKQIFEMAELFGFETRNKYRVCDEQGRDVAYAAEQQKGIFGFLFRQFMGHWRTFEIHFFGANRSPLMIAIHPFRWFFQCLQVYDSQNKYIGVIERKFGILSKKFQVENSRGQVIFEVSSPFWRIWTFPFYRNGREAARVAKKWSGIGSELFTDRDNFLVEYIDPTLGMDDRALVLVAAIYVDMLYFERKGSGGVLDS